MMHNSSILAFLSLPPGSGMHIFKPWLLGARLGCYATIHATGEGAMGCAVVGLKTRVLEMYPEIEKMKVILSLTFD